MTKHYNTHKDFLAFHYGDYKTPKGQINTTAVKIGSLTLFFSYATIIAFQEQGQPLRVIDNYSDAITGHHLNLIHPIPKSKFKIKPEHIRLSAREFSAYLDDLLARHNLSKEQGREEQRRKANDLIVQRLRSFFDGPNFVQADLTRDAFYKILHDSKLEANGHKEQPK